MKFAKSILLAAGVSIGATPVVAAESDGSRILRTLQRFATQYVIMVSRTFVDLTYETLTIEPGTNDLILSGLTLFPVLDWDQEAACKVEIDRIVMADFNDLDHFQSTIEVSGLTLPNACFDPMVGSTLAGVGYNGLTADTMMIEIGYDLPSSAADVSVQASVVDAGNISLTAAFNYLWVRIDPDGNDDPVPSAWLREAELSFENAGLWEVLEPMIAAQFGDVNALPQMAQMMVGQSFTDGGTRAPTAAESAFVENLSAELARFIKEKNRIVLTAAPKDGVWLDEFTFEGGPAAIITALQPAISGVPLAYRGMIGPDQLQAALGGGALDDAERLRIGEALLSGIGAPRSVQDGRSLLQPLAEGWNGRAALLVSKAQADAGDVTGAYAMAMRALASGEAGAAGHADSLEPGLDVAQILQMQQAAAQAWPGKSGADSAIAAMIQSADVGGLRSMAHAAALGKKMPRAYDTAYFLASLAAAAGDKGAASLRDRLDRRFANAETDAWRTVAGDAANRALQEWMSTMGAKIADRVR